MNATEALKLKARAIMWARCGARLNPGIMFSYILNGRIHSFELDKYGNMQES